MAFVVGICVLVPAEVQAGRGGGGHGGGGHAGGGRGMATGGGRGGFRGAGYDGHEGGRNYGGGYGGYGGFGGYGGYGYGGIGLGVGLGYGGYGYGYPYAGYGSTYGATNYLPSYSYVQPTVYTAQNYYNMPGYVATGSNVGVQQSAYYSPPATNFATVDVRVPANAKVWFDGQPTIMTGADRVFSSPPLDASKTFEYEIKAEWMQNGTKVEKTMTVQVGAGKRSLADFVTTKEVAAY